MRRELLFSLRRLEEASAQRGIPSPKEARRGLCAESQLFSLGRLEEASAQRFNSLPRDRARKASLRLFLSRFTVGQLSDIRAHLSTL